VEHPIFLETLFEQINLIDEGRHSFFTNKSERPILETDRMKPSITMIRGQNSSAISHRIWEICDCSFFIEIETFNGHLRFDSGDSKIGKI
jgi:hypothetical protein